MPHTHCQRSLAKYSSSFASSLVTPSSWFSSPIETCLATSRFLPCSVNTIVGARLLTWISVITSHISISVFQLSELLSSGQIGGLLFGSVTDISATLKKIRMENVYYTNPAEITHTSNQLASVKVIGLTERLCKRDSCHMSRSWTN